jgi:predicted RND superfamily exporter protein
MTALTMALGVMLWCFSSIQFQADMGVLLMFMFVWNMLGAVVLIPVLLCLMGGPPKVGVQQSLRVAADNA